MRIHPNYLPNLQINSRTQIFAEMIKCIHIYQQQSIDSVPKHKDQWVHWLLECPWEMYNPQFFSQIYCNSLKVILRGNSQGFNWVNMSAGGAQREYMLSQLYFYTYRHKRCGAAYLKGTQGGRQLRKKRCCSSETNCIVDRVRNVVESLCLSDLTQKFSLQVRHIALLLCTKKAYVNKQKSYQIRENKVCRENGNTVKEIKPS